MRIREALEGRRIALTGVTGFLGTALVERLLTDVPVGRLDLYMRGRAESRLRGIFGSSAFRPFVEANGREALDRLVEEKVRPVTADFSAGPPPVADDIDLVIHTAATVSFDPPIDDAFDTNLMGTVGLYGAAGGRPFIHVSTAYVAGITRGTLPEELLPRRADWRVEAAEAARIRDAVEADSRRPETLRRFHYRAQSERGRVGPQSVARRAEDLRRDWVKTRLVEYGRARARSLGWPDVYGFTKALTEMALDEIAGDNPLTIVRPSIIESALIRPFPGWIEGFRMAEPLILAFGRGALPEFPGIPEGVLDIIPVDLVVNAICAAAAAPPERRRVLQVCSGSRNPLKYREMYDHTRSYFSKHPMPEPQRGYYKVPEWSFPGKRVVDQRMAAGERLIGYAERLVARLPRTLLSREAAGRLDDLKGRFDFLKKYAELYGAYVEAEVIHLDSRVAALYDSLADEDRRDFPFDPAAIDWTHYLEEVHMPAVTASVRRAGRRRSEPQVKIEDGASGGVVLAVFDIEGTVVQSNVLEPYLWLRMAEIDGPERLKELLSLAARLPSLLKAERRDRGEFLRKFYRSYAGADADGMKALASEALESLSLRRVAPAAVRRIRRHRAAGHRIVFITGSLDFCVGPIGGLADEVVGAKLREAGGVFTGDLERPPLVGEARAAWLRDYADAEGIDLSVCYGYADSMSDLPLLEAVGKSVAVNAEIGLYRIARLRRWPVEEWPVDKGTPRVLVPERRLTAGRGR